MVKSRRKKKKGAQEARLDKSGSRSPQKPDNAGFMQRTLVQILLIAVLGFLAYSNTFHSPFQWDEKSQILENPLIKDPGGPGSHAEGYAYNPRRFIGYLTFALNYQAGRFDVAGYHIVNLVVHIANAILVYFLVILVFRTPSMQRAAGSSPALSPVLIALFSALLFVSHPLQTQAVTYVVQRFTSLATLFYLFSIVSYVNSRLTPSMSSSKHRSFLWYSLSFVSAVAAMQTKEIAFTLPVVIVLCELMFFEGEFKKRVLFLIPLLSTMLIIPLGLAGTAGSFGDLLSDLGRGTSLQTNLPRWDYLMTEMRVIITYIRLLFVPMGQNLDYDYPTYHSLFTLPVFVSFVFLLSVFGLVAYLLHASRAARLKPAPFAPYYRFIGFGIVWFFVTLSVESSIIPIVDVIFEHRIYLPSAGAFAAITTGVLLMAGRLRIERLVVSVLVVTTLAISGVTYARNNVWKSEIGLWEDVVRKSPHKARPHNNLGYLYFEEGRREEALREYQTALRINPRYADAHNNLGNVYYLQGRTDDALREFQAALKINPEYADAHNNLGSVYYSQGRSDEAIREFQAALKVNPHFAGAHFNLGLVYSAQVRLEEAIREFQAALRINPEHADVHNNLGSVYYLQGRTDDALREFQAALKIKPDHAGAHFNLALAYSSQDRIDEALREIQAALKINPNLPQARTILESLKKKAPERGERKGGE
jgi:tetratricopeptide (TPR) repeat protein